jgi:hypothetical protein
LTQGVFCLPIFKTHRAQIRFERLRDFCKTCYNHAILLRMPE